MNLSKTPHAAGGFKFKLTTGKGNTKFGESKKQQIISALKNSDTEGVYETTHKKIRVQKLNGTCTFI